jgi:hypothetical protein
MYDYHIFINTVDRVEYMIFRLHTYQKKYLMVHLHCFNGLACVEFIIPPFDWDAIIFSVPYYTLQEIFDSLNSLTIECVYISNVGCEWDILQSLKIGDRLPNFQGLCLGKVEVDYELGTPLRDHVEHVVEFSLAVNLFQNRVVRKLRFILLPCPILRCTMRSRFCAVNPMACEIRSFFRR